VPDESLRAAYRACEALARSHYENFPVASRLLPAAMRPHIAAVYAFARIGDDIADEQPDVAPVVRQRQLREWQERIHRAVRDEHDENEPRGGREALIARAVANSIRARELPLTLFDDLLSAFGQDTMTNRYNSWADLFDYCRRSANPVGRLVLRIAGYRDVALDRSSDALCTALQLANFWQDFGRDWRAGRLYLPREEWRAAGADEAELRAGMMSEPWQRALQGAFAMTRDRFSEGRLVCDRVTGRLGLELRFTWLGGSRILDRAAARVGDLLEYRPSLGGGDLPALAWAALRWRRS